MPITNTTPITQMPLNLNPNDLSAGAKTLTRGDLVQLANRVDTAKLSALTWGDLRSLEQAFNKAKAGTFNANGDPLTNDACCCAPCCCCCAAVQTEISVV
jgi:hypothetical protein